MFIGTSKQNFIGDRVQRPVIKAGSCHTGRSDWSNCTRCGLHNTRNRVAIYRSHSSDWGPRILFIGEAPGQLEDKTGLPFVGHSGRIFQQYINFCNRDFPYTITNAVGCRPVTIVYLDYDHDKEQPDLKDLILDEDYELYDWNREPTKAEIAACKPHIDEIIESEKPKGIIYLGKIAESYKTKLPKLSLLHPAAIARLEYKLLPTLRQARKITNFVDKLSKGT